MVFEGDLSKNKGSGTFKFNRNKNFVSFLEKENIDTSDQIYYFKLFLGDVNENYISDIKKMGYSPTIRELGRLVYHDASLNYIESMSLIYQNLELDTISKFAAHNITSDYITSFNTFNFDSLDPILIKKAKIHNITPEFIERARIDNYNSNDFNDYIKFKINKKLKTFRSK